MDAPLVELHRGQAQHDLDRYVLTAAEGAADGRIDHPDPLGGQVEGVSDLLLVLMGPLARDLHRHPALAVDVGHARLGLQVGVLLVSELVGRLHHHVGVGPALLHVALADAQRVVGVGGLAVLGVDHRLRGQRLVDVGQHRQRLPPGLDGGRPRPGRVGRLGHDQRQPVRLPAGNVTGQVTAAGVLEADEHGMVGHGEAELVDGHIGRAEHGDHSLDGLGGGEVEPGQAGVGLVGEHRHGPQRVGRDPVARVGGRAGELGRRIDAGRGGADAHSPAPPGSPAPSPLPARASMIE